MKIEGKVNNNSFLNYSVCELKGLKKIGESKVTCGKKRIQTKNNYFFADLIFGKYILTLLKKSDIDASGILFFKI